MKTDKILNVLLWSVTGVSLVLVILATIFASISRNFSPHPTR